ncbi:hypothetical protein KFL_000120560 [Klebsormidium nitens]|uniref:Uncharacterized protein n=1 Tax=Klebsormidium nitens TaxID=105231 RepID=A0A1Y1HIS7_KLENI|nr:hypothetical protein KFL_000120560 [Klebsormidium nitens]|eukprot:GAQ78410.1 hypothetical protein KFL_000120560 [Klebsormidium nitens]
MVREGISVYQELIAQNLLLQYLQKANVKVCEAGDVTSQSFARQVNGLDAQAALANMHDIARALLHSGRDKKIKNNVLSLQTLLVEHARGNVPDPIMTLQSLSKAILEKGDGKAAAPAVDASLEVDLYIHTRRSRETTSPGKLTITLVGLDNIVEPLNPEPQTPKDSPIEASENSKITPSALPGTNSLVVAESSLVEEAGIPKKVASLERAAQVALQRARLAIAPNSSSITNVETTSTSGPEHLPPTSMGVDQPSAPPVDPSSVDPPTNVQHVPPPDALQRSTSSQSTAPADSTPLTDLQSTSDCSFSAPQVIVYAALALHRDSQPVARRLVELHPDIFPNLSALHKVGALLYVSCEHLLAQDVSRLLTITTESARTANEAASSSKLAADKAEESATASKQSAEASARSAEASERSEQASARSEAASERSAAASERSKDASERVEKQVQILMSWMKGAAVVWLGTMIAKQLGVFKKS